MLCFPSSYLLVFMFDLIQSFASVEATKKRLWEIFIRLQQIGSNLRKNATRSIPETKHDRWHLFSNYFVICWRCWCCCSLISFSEHSIWSISISNGIKYKPKMICLHEKQSILPSSPTICFHSFALKLFDKTVENHNRLSQSNSGYMNTHEIVYLHKSRHKRITTINIVAFHLYVLIRFALLEHGAECVIALCFVCMCGVCFAHFYTTSLSLSANSFVSINCLH